MTLVREESVAIARTCDDALAVAADFVAYTCDVDVDDAVDYCHFVGPYLSEQFLAREDAVWLRQQFAQYFEFFTGHSHLGAVDGAAFD